MANSLMFALLTTMSIVPLPQASSEADKAVTKENRITATVTITAIDHATRSVTLRSENGDEDRYTVRPDVTRFNQLKVGDTITATYVESLVLQVRKPGAPAATTGAVAAGGRLKDVPGALIGMQETRTVTVKAVDLNAPSITVVAADGKSLTRKIRDKKHLEGVAAGDRIDITYTQGLVVSAEPSKK